MQRYNAATLQCRNTTMLRVRGKSDNCQIAQQLAAPLQEHGLLLGTEAIATTAAGGEVTLLTFRAEGNHSPKC